MRDQNNTSRKQRGSSRTKENTPEWPSVTPDVLQQLQCAHEILTSNGFLVNAVNNPLGDARSWVLICQPKVKLPKGHDSTESIRQRLQREGVNVHKIAFKRDQTAYVFLQPIPRPITAVKVREESPSERRSTLLNEGYDINLAKFMEQPDSLEYKMREALEEAKAAMKRATQAPGLTPSSTSSDTPTGLQSDLPVMQTATPDSMFRHSPDYRSITFKGKDYTTTARQAQIIEILHSAFKRRSPDLSDSFILEKVGSTTSRLRDSFKGSNSELWGTLIVSKRKGTRRLNPIQ